MKLQDSVVEFHSRGVQGRSDYKVAQTAKVMDMFSNMLYKDKIKAVIRELSTNAWDAHVAAGNTHKIPQITLPTHVNLEFKIRDYGTGLSPEDLEGMYTTYGMSNKSNSNDFNGCMGIGSKSPFAYSSSFTTTSYYNGKKYMYVNAKDKNNMPTLSKVLEIDTYEPNGLEVSFAVKASDIMHFYSKTISVLKWFPVQFKVIDNGKIVEINNETEYLFRGDEWKLRSNKGSRDSHAIMGYIEYPICASHFEGSKREIKKQENDWYSYYKDKDNTNLSFYYNLLRSGIELHFNIGEVEMDISREGLQYTDQTIQSIKDKLDIAYKEICEAISKEIGSCKTHWEAACKLTNFKYNDKYSYLVNSLNLDRMDIKWKGYPIDTSAINIKSEYVDKEKISVIKFYRESYNKTVKRDTDPEKITHNSETKFYINDIEKGAYSICNRILSQCSVGGKKVYLISDYKDNDPDLSKLAAVLKCNVSDFIYCSSVPKPPKDPSVNKKVNEKVFKFHHSIYEKSSPSVYWKSSEIDFKDGGYFVEINNWRIRDSEHSVNDLNSIYNSFVNLGINNIPDIYGIKSCGVKKFKSDSNWQSIFEFFKETFNELVETHKINDYIVVTKQMNSFTYYRHILKIYNYIKQKKILLKDNLFKNFLDKFEEFDKIKSKWSSKVDVYITMANKLRVDLASSISHTEIQDMYAKVLKSYPFFQLLEYHSYYEDSQIEAVVNSIIKFDS